MRFLRNIQIATTTDLRQFVTTPGSEKTTLIKNPYISYRDYPTFVIFYSRILGRCANMYAKFQAIWYFQQRDIAI